MIKRYTSDRYLGPRIGFGFRTLVTAKGMIFGVRYVYAEFMDEEEVAPGVVPPEFVKRARVGFIRRYLKIRADR